MSLLDEAATGMHSQENQDFGPPAKRQFQVIDNLFSECQIAEFYRHLRWMPYALNDSDGEEFADVSHWKTEHGALFYGPSAPLIDLATRVVTETLRRIPGLPFRPTRTHANLHMYGDCQHPHRDSEAGGFTALYFANPGWEQIWGGETVFFDPSGEASGIVSVRPGRVVLFPGSIVHRAGVPTRRATEPRISVAFKWQKPKTL